MRDRHPILLICWVGVLALGAFGLATGGWLFLVALLASPLLAVATLAALVRRNQLVLFRRGWRMPYYLASGIVASASVAGIFAASARLVRFGDGAHYIKNGPLALLFLLTLFAAWPAVTRPTPRRAAIPAVVFHLAWIPLLLLNFSVDAPYVSEPEWHELVLATTLLVLPVASVLTSILALVAFAGVEPIAQARQVEA